MPRKLVRRTPEPGLRAVVSDPQEELEPAEQDIVPPAERDIVPLLYNVSDACFILGNISKQMLYRLIHLHRIHPVKIGTRSLFTMEELQRYVREQQAEPTG